MIDLEDGDSKPDLIEIGAIYAWTAAGAYVAIRFGNFIPPLVSGSLLACSGIIAIFAFHRQRNWVHLSFAVVHAIGCAGLVVFALKRGLRWWDPLFVALVAWNTYDHVSKYFAARRETNDADDAPMVSIVALFKDLPFLDAAVIRRHVASAWGEQIELVIEDDAEDESTSFVVGEAPMFIIQCDLGMFIIHYFDRPYFDDSDEVAGLLRDMRASHVVQSHKTWLSVDYIAGEADELPAQFAMVSKLLAEIVDDDCVGLIIPAVQRCIPWESSFEEALRSEDPLRAICPELAPVVRVKPDDPRMLAAVEQARETFPQFIDAFENRDASNSDGDFAVKAPITVDEVTEFIWICVTGIENGVIYGTLGNDPVNLGDLQDGDRVKVDVADLNDWMYPADDDFAGGFTVKLLAQMMQEPVFADDDDGDDDSE